MKIQQEFKSMREAIEYLEARGWQHLAQSRENIFWNPELPAQRRYVNVIRSGHWVITSDMGKLI